MPKYTKGHRIGCPVNLGDLLLCCANVFHILWVCFADGISLPWLRTTVKVDNNDDTNIKKEKKCRYHTNRYEFHLSGNQRFVSPSQVASTISVSASNCCFISNISNIIRFPSSLIKTFVSKCGASGARDFLIGNISKALEVYLCWVSVHYGEKYLWGSRKYSAVLTIKGLMNFILVKSIIFFGQNNLKNRLRLFFIWTCFLCALWISLKTIEWDKLSLEKLGGKTVGKIN